MKDVISSSTNCKLSMKGVGKMKEDLNAPLASVLPAKLVLAGSCVGQVISVLEWPAMVYPSLRRKCAKLVKAVHPTSVLKVFTKQDICVQERTIMIHKSV